MSIVKFHESHYVGVLDNPQKSGSIQTSSVTMSMG